MDADAVWTHRVQDFKPDISRLSRPGSRSDICISSREFPRTASSSSRVKFNASVSLAWLGSPRTCQLRPPTTSKISHDENKDSSSRFVPPRFDKDIHCLLSELAEIGGYGAENVVNAGGSVHKLPI
ncbi:hypothetical protein Bbelb_411920, partial [Branchiostoma belcheri]